MILKECMLIRNDCYRKFQYMNDSKPTGIVVHSTGANNPYIKRYVQPLDCQTNYDMIMKDLGKNTSDNHWNKSIYFGETSRAACVHAFIGKNAKGQIETYQTMPFFVCCWGVGNGSKGSYNYNPTARIQFEICEDDLSDKSYFNAVFKEAAEFCAYLCQQYKLDPIEDICSHHESYLAGFGGDHSDCDHWLKRFGKTMNDFRNQVLEIYNKNKESIPMTDSEKVYVKELENRIKKLEAAKKIYNTWDELPSWALSPVKALYDAKFFAGESATKLGIEQTKLEMLVILANILKKQKIIKY